MQTLEKAPLDAETVAQQRAFSDRQAREKSMAGANTVRKLRAYVDDMVSAGVTLAQIAIESGVKTQRLNAWINGSDDDDIIMPLLAWRGELEREAKARDGGFVMTPTAQKIINAFDRAREPQLNSRDGYARGIAMIYGASGVGKSETAGWYRDQTHHEFCRRSVVVVRCTGDESSINSVLVAILASMDNADRWNVRYRTMYETIFNCICPGGIIIFDESQLMSLRRLDELRIFPDKYGIAVALLGNLSGYKAIVDAKITQITSRVAGEWVHVVAPSEGDVDALLDAWEIRGRREREFCTLIGTQDGGLRRLAGAVSKAREYAQANGVDIGVDLLKAAAVQVGAWGAGQ